MSVCRFVLTKFSKTVLKNAANLDRIAPFSAPMYSSKPPQPVVVEKGLSDIIVPKKPKRPIVPKITLLSGQDDISVTTLEEAQKLAKRRDLKLVKIIDIDTKTQRPVYKLMTATEYNAEEVKQKKEKQKNTAFKGEKLLMLGANITEHDLQTQIKKIQKWIQKDIEVRTVINDSSGGEKAEEIYKMMEENLKDAVRFIQKRKKGVDLRFSIIPPKRDKSTDKRDSTNSGGTNL